MPLNKTQLKNDIIGLLTDMRTRNIESDEEFATRLSDAIEDYVKSGDGFYQIGTLQAGSQTVVAIGTVQIKMK
jgi:hypothetical protein